MKNLYGILTELNEKSYLDDYNTYGSMIEELKDNVNNELDEAEEMYNDAEFDILLGFEIFADDFFAKNGKSVIKHDALIENDKGYYDLVMFRLNNIKELINDFQEHFFNNKECV